MTTALTRPPSAPATAALRRPERVASAGPPCPASGPPRVAHPGLVHAVEVHRATDELSGEPEVAVCGAIVIAGSKPFQATAAACGVCAAAAG